MIGEISPCRLCGVQKRESSGGGLFQDPPHTKMKLPSRSVEREGRRDQAMLRPIGPGGRLAIRVERLSVRLLEVDAGDHDLPLQVRWPEDADRLFFFNETDFVAANPRIHIEVLDRSDGAVVDQAKDVSFRFAEAAVLGLAVLAERLLLPTGQLNRQRTLTERLEVMVSHHLVTEHARARRKAIDELHAVDLDDDSLRFMVFTTLRVRAVREHNVVAVVPDIGLGRRELAVHAAEDGLISAVLRMQAVHAPLGRAFCGSGHSPLEVLDVGDRSFEGQAGCFDPERFPVVPNAGARPIGLAAFGIDHGVVVAGALVDRAHLLGQILRGRVAPKKRQIVLAL
ncbi:MAG: hypothetical protein AB203_01575 [Parcubacteria bacterium C7867-008]|nr:MAG: hypothetical protein AB203_01575 [Parcubacteria bacterium C7867-008]